MPYRIVLEVDAAPGDFEVCGLAQWIGFCITEADCSVVVNRIEVERLAA